MTKDDLTRSYEAALARIRAFVKTPGWSKSHLALAAGMSPNALRDADRGRWKPTVETVQKLLAVIEHEEAKASRLSRRQRDRIGA